MKLWVDDVRPSPKNFDLSASSYKTAIEFIESGAVSEISLDHDLGVDPDTKALVKTGYDIACYIEKGAYSGHIKPMKWAVHSANPVGSKQIEQAMKSADKAWAKNK